jgi:hypothetical protein
MKWEVEWSEDAEVAIGGMLYYATAGRRAIMDAMSAIEAELEENPYDCGESREDDLRIVIHPPLAVLCTVYQERFLVVVHTAWSWPRTA